MLMRNKVVVVSGIGPGLGIKLAVEAAREGAHAVVVAARTAAKLDEAEQRIRELGVDCQVLKVTADITDRQQCKHLVEQAIERFDRIDALVNSAFVHGKFPEPIEEADLEGWRSVFDTNVFGTMNLTLEVVPHMKKRGSGAIVMINTQAVRKPFPGESGYAASKGALAVAVKYLARELGAHGIRANSIHMGWMWGAPVQEHVRQAAAAYDVPQEQIIAPIAANIALGHISTDDDCAKAALFLVSDYAKVITGATLDANGGDFMP
ncbi:3-oxoacyl-[acyl-carrier-protein] reductase FabG [Paraburkholderia domus]|jgi:NAD(P)-dependent dehydrogenase (short-subunit alcohol dehydrogenase family)|uniref:SDR family oxidoreductase n=1 Tax=Paraburkholderia domus TaxID=2793075 RepID=UPI0019112E82|nr:SDR family oxidoreductase [Paraburkholderia domus]MBK5090270.1 SDR family oxidoreductase [Burkholderia sp. R-69927]CAE6845068.1 3-oxoacyl-[acyl-carrier-protein] reductase FabG [Paraburkholderia domus]CAE6915389.1 3-oxoacyl-[acyl-carrier-protein] reductase FabG [Paraburkholderia domus]